MLKTFISIVMAAGVLTVMGIGSPWAAEQKSPPVGGQKVTLMLGGNFCDSYPDDVETALKKVPGVKVVDLWGDHQKGPFGALLKLPAGFLAPLHTHTHTMKVVFLSGTYIQAPEGKPEVRLGAGSYMMQPGGNYRHTTRCDRASECVFFVESDGPFDLKPVVVTK